MEDVQHLKSFFSLVFFFRNKAAELGAWFEREVEGPLAGKEASSLENAIFRYLGVFRKFPRTYSLQFTGKDPLMQADLDTV